MSKTQFNTIKTWTTLFCCFMGKKPPPHHASQRGGRKLKAGGEGGGWNQRRLHFIRPWNRMKVGVVFGVFGPRFTFKAMGRTEKEIWSLRCDSSNHDRTVSTMTEWIHWWLDWWLQQSRKWLRMGLQANSLELGTNWRTDWRISRMKRCDGCT